jgi:hypothetical protein
MAGLDKALVVLFACVIVGIGVHFFVPRLLRASTIAAIGCGTLFTVVALIQEGRLSIIPFLFGGAYAWVFAFVLGLPFYLVRRWISRH